MTRQITATEFRAKALALLDQVATGDEIAITKHGRTVARLVGARGPRAIRGWLTSLSRSLTSTRACSPPGSPGECPDHPVARPSRPVVMVG